MPLRYSSDPITACVDSSCGGRGHNGGQRNVPPTSSTLFPTRPCRRWHTTSTVTPPAPPPRPPHSTPTAPTETPAPPPPPLPPWPAACTAAHALHQPHATRGTAARRPSPSTCPRVRRPVAPRQAAACAKRGDGGRTGRPRGECAPADEQSRHPSLRAGGTAALLHVAGGDAALTQRQRRRGVERSRGGVRDRGCRRTRSQRRPDGRARDVQTVAWHSADGAAAIGRTLMPPLAIASSDADSWALVWDAECARIASPPPPDSLPVAAAATRCAGRCSPTPARACRHGE